MAKVNNEAVLEVSKEISKFLDKTNLHWYSKPESNKVTFCTSINDILEGKGETFEYTNKILSTKVVNKNDKEKEYNHLYLFVLTDGRFILARKWGELK